ncbi:hypothetical protein PG5_29720 [Pseudomonas sp. G5(2012)]|nr:hypothetical protein PG5_29720 [Pseudomonas sp. G5(2012)]
MRCAPIHCGSEPAREEAGKYNEFPESNKQFSAHTQSLMSGFSLIAI